MGDDQGDRDDGWHQLSLQGGVAGAGPDHPDTLTTCHNLASWRGEAGDPTGAAAAFEELLADELRVLGPDHPDIPTVRNNLAYWQARAEGPEP